MLKVNNTEITDVVFNGVNLDKIIYNGVVVFEKKSGPSETYLTQFQIPRITINDNVDVFTIKNI